MLRILIANGAIVLLVRHLDWAEVVFPASYDLGADGTAVGDIHAKNRQRPVLISNST